MKIIDRQSFSQIYNKNNKYIINYYNKLSKSLNYKQFDLNIYYFQNYYKEKYI